MMFSSRVVGDVRDALRQLRHEPIYAGLMIVTLAIGIAAAAAIFAVVRGVILRPLPYKDSQSIVALQEYQPAKRREPDAVASANVPRLEAARSLAGVSAFGYSEFVLSDDRDAERVIGATIDGNLLPVLGVRPSLGRGITSEEGGPNPSRVVMLSDAAWRRRFAGDANAVGQSITINGAPYTIVGIMPRGFEFPRNPLMNRDVEIWVPRRAASPMMMRRGMRDLTVIARLRRGVSLHDAQLELSTISDRAAADDAALNAGWRLRAIGLRDMMVGTVRPVLFMLAACVGVLLLIACANASAGALARIVTRRQSLGIRLALGASQSRLAELLVSESLLLAILAAIVALPLSAVIRRLLIRVAPVAIPRQDGIAVDGWTIGFALGIALIIGCVTAAGPATWLRRLNLTTFLSDAGRTATGSRGRSRALAIFVVAQLALGTVLLSATARLYANFARLNSVDPGFAPDNVTTATIALGGMRYRDPRARASLTTQLLDRVRNLPGVQHAAATSLLPMSGGIMSSGYTPEGATADSSNSAALRAVSSDFFRTVGIPIKQGRGIEPADGESGPPVVVINEALARQSFGGRSALGQSILVSPPGSDSARTFQIVGIARDAKEKDLLGPATPIIYFSDRQASFPHSVLVVRSQGQFPFAAIRRALRELDPSLALDDVGSLAARVRSSYALQYFLLTILGAFALSGALLIAVGVYGSVSFTTAADVRSIGVRMALGATPLQVLALVLRRTGALAVLGCTIGVIVASVLPRLVGAELMLGTGLGLAASFAGAFGILVVAIMATMIPARRASALEPVTVLRA